MTIIVRAGPDEIARAAALLRAGRLVAFPTETVYGLGALAVDERAVARVFDVKGRPRFDPLIVHVADERAARQVATEFPLAAERLARRFWPGPLTLVLPRSSSIPELVTAGAPTVAIRVPDHPVALELLRAVGLPVAAPSANRFGGISPTTAEHVRDQFTDSIDLILDGGPCRVGVESTVVQLANERPEILRLGGTTVEEIEEVVGPVVVSSPVAADHSAHGLLSPGTLPRHYAPRTPLTVCWRAAAQPSAAPILEQLASQRPRTSRMGLLALQAPLDAGRFASVEILSPAGDLCEAAAKFFGALRRLDSAGLDRIVALPFPEHGLGRALNDRLRRAEHE